MPLITIKHEDGLWRIQAHNLLLIGFRDGRKVSAAVGQWKIRFLLAFLTAHIASNSRNELKTQGTRAFSLAIQELGVIMAQILLAALFSI